MAFSPEVTTVNQRLQIGAESTSALGTAVAAGKSLECFDWVAQINGDVQFYTPTGHKYPSLQEENTEWVDVTVTGDLDYNGVLYPLAGAMGSVAAVAHGASATAKDWVFQPPIVGTIVPQTYTVQQGDAVRARSWSYGIFTEWGYKVTRKTLSMSAKMLGQPISDGITLTASPSVIPVLPVVSKQFNVYLDTTSAGLGTTQLLRPLSLDFLMTNIYGPLFVLNRSNIGWVAHVDLMPKSTIKLKMEANAEGMAMLAYLQSGTTYYLRVQALGLIIDNIQTLTIGGGATSGNFTLSYKGQTTANIAYSAALTAATIQTAFQLLSTVGSNYTVSGSAGGPYTFTAGGALATDMSAITATNVSLTGGTPTITAVANANNVFQHDMAVKFGKPTAFADDQGVYSIEWEATVVEDSTWGAAPGTAQKVTVTNLLTAL